ncbi:NADH-quinone oxidoreductase subunit L [Candidatus Berkiella aquae]|uniref:NADH-quinone oxidoreductase subunit L n=1 Tax=Candidatus Berkiella aquae TaxID=295108 RepID=A0AAE3HU66_9GAMM|nr:NADH-quinone oxidoreductase subunit L [Candidatus Berkiella aquae]
MLTECLIVVFSPLLAAIIAGLGKKLVGRAGAHSITIIAVAVSFFTSLLIAKQMLLDKSLPMQLDMTLYTWAAIEPLRFQVGFLLDSLTVLMMCVVTFVSWMVHIYTIGYMHEDPGYQRFFSYISLFTFAMLMLVMSNNFLQLFFGWEAVGLVSYLLIGFWFKRESAIFANLKAFLVNRVGDFGFLLGISAVLMVFGTLDYLPVFQKAPGVAAANPMIEIIAGHEWSAFTVIGILLFIGAMGKSAQVPLHVWLPDSMEGPTPISALIHAATMVTAGVFMVARMSPLFEYSDTALAFIMTIGAATCFLMGLVGIVQNDIKRVVAYSTLSQLGYMVTALGVSAYAAGIFHLMTHAFFKALLFLGAGSVIIAMHHEQDIRQMGGLRKYMPITYITMLLGSLALIGFPFFSGFYSKDTIIEAVHLSNLPGANIAYWLILGSVFVTALYSFRMFFLVFHTKERMDEHTRSHLHESPMVVWLPLVLLAIPSVVIGAWFMGPVFGDFFNGVIYVLPEHGVMKTLAEEFHGPVAMALHGFTATPFYLAIAGVVVAYVFYVLKPSLAETVRKIFSPLYTVLVNKYGFDAFNQTVIAGGTRGIGRLFWHVGDEKLIDGLIVNGSAKTVGFSAKVLRHLQSGYVYHYAFAMITGLLALTLWLMVRG